MQFAGTWHKVGRLNGTGVYDSGHIRFEIDGDDVSILTTGVRYVMTSCKQRVMAINYNVKCHANHQYLCHRAMSNSDAVIACNTPRDDVLITTVFVTAACQRENASLTSIPTIRLNC